MKAWVVSNGDWCSLVHAETRGKAIVQVRLYVDNWNEFTDFRAIRLPGLDNNPITYQDAKDAGFEYLNDDGTPISENDFTNDCRCNICIPKAKR